MADYSKEFVERHFEDPEFPWDFCIEDIGMTLQPDEYVAMICEGYGFTGIYMTPEGERSVIYTLEEVEGGNAIEVISIVDLDKRYNEGSLPWQKDK
jgi:hypothetical protein